MKTSFLYICFFTISLLSAQDRVESIDDNFNKIKISNSLDVDLIPHASENKIEIIGHDADKVKIKISQGRLKVSLPIDEVFSESNTKVKIYAKDFSSLKLNNGAEVEITSALKQKDIDINISEGSFLSAELEVETAQLKIVTGAEMHLYGTAKNQYLTIKTGGIFIGKSFKTKQTEVKVSYGGTAKVYASESCRAQTIAGGTVNIYGQPRSVDQKTKLGGTIEEVED